MYLLIIVRLYCTFRYFWIVLYLDDIDFHVNYHLIRSERCPVRSFVKMIRRLNANCDRLCQKPRSTSKSGVYYNNIPVGHNQLGQFMQNISKCSLFIRYNLYIYRVERKAYIDFVLGLSSRYTYRLTSYKGYICILVLLSVFLLFLTHWSWLRCCFSHVEIRITAGETGQQGIPTPSWHLVPPLIYSKVCVRPFSDVYFL
jgi:hypothetical protein